MYNWGSHCVQLVGRLCRGPVLAPLTYPNIPSCVCSAKLGYGLLSGEYSKPAPDPGDDPSLTPEPRV